MAYYCGECAVWAGSSDVDRYGRRWCSYSRRYEESNQQTYGCKGFVYNGRTVLTKVCEILNMSTDKWYEAFDGVKESFVAPQHMEWLTSYCSLGPCIACSLEADAAREKTAKDLVDKYIRPAYILWEKGEVEQSANKYRDMIVSLVHHYHCSRAL